MHFELDTVDALLAHLAEYEQLDGVVCQGLNLSHQTETLLGVTAAGAAFLGCQLEDRALLHVIATGGIVFPRLADVPYHPYRSTLYTIEELMEGYRRGEPGSFQRDALDMTIYQHFTRFRLSNESPPLLEALAQRLHDHAIDDALNELLGQHPQIVAIMGGHRLVRGEKAYRDVAHIAHGLTARGYFIATGGGPGAMEAANLGAHMARYQPDELESAIDMLAGEPSYKSNAYLDLGFAVRDRYPDAGQSLAVPTWFYGHEPTNQFASHIAKYFANSIREDVLLAIASSGVVYAPGSAGTIQEIFMDAAQNHYGSFKVVSPMVFYNTAFWSEHTPIFPLLRQLAVGKQYHDLISIHDSPDDIIHFIESHRPIPYDPNY
ncbi:MAG: hypothetical protein SH809_17725 [Rhodothermales bacterium]|nr:hypothetical protein [Rhodothermales bacterium]